MKYLGKGLGVRCGDPEHPSPFLQNYFGIPGQYSGRISRASSPEESLRAIPGLWCLHPVQVARFGGYTSFLDYLER